MYTEDRVSVSIYPDGGDSGDSGELADLNGSRNVVDSEVLGRCVFFPFMYAVWLGLRRGIEGPSTER
jgi:hypothetical protein